MKHSPFLAALSRMSCLALVVVFLSGMLVFSAGTSASAVLVWNSPNHYRVTLTVNPGAVARDYSPASVNVDFQQLLTNMGNAGTFDRYTVEVIAYNASGQPKVIDATRPGYEQYLLPSRVDPYFGVNYVTVNFAMPDQTYTTYVAYFDTVESGLGKPDRYAGLVGDGDFFREVYSRREINANKCDAFVDFDGDGDLDLFEGGTECFLYYWENVGDGNRMVERGRLTSGGSLFYMPRNLGNNRSWVTPTFHDWDNDGDVDFMCNTADGPDSGKFVLFENTTTENGGVLTFTRIGYMQTVTGTLLAAGSTQGFFPALTFVQDWDGDGDGRTDVLVGANNTCYLHRNLGGVDAYGFPRLADAVAIQAGGVNINLNSPRFDVADIDSDGDLDLFAGTNGGPIYWFRNTGTRTNPVFAAGVIVGYNETYMIVDLHASLKIADWDGDGLLDFVAGRYWERTAWELMSEPKNYGGLYKNVGTATNPVFERRGAYEGSPYTDQFQPCDAIRQNGVRTVDWNNDGKPDLIAGDTDGCIWYFRNTTSRLFPVFAPGVKIYANGAPLSLWQSGGGHARMDIVDWNNDGKKDLISGDSNGYVWLFLNIGTDASPAFGAGTRVYADGVQIDNGGRSSVHVCDWNTDGKKDLIHADDTAFRFYLNTGSDASPVLAYQSAETIDPSDGSFQRPNMGSWVDWDGDGKKDMIGGEFENSIRLYRNTGTASNPYFSNSNGTSTIIRPYTVQMCSGADAKDWNLDGDIDILTGMGHGGSYLRYYERDYINDVNNSTLPTTTVGSSERGYEVNEFKARADGGATVIVPEGVVTAAAADYLYVENLARTTGIRVQKTAHGRSIGQKVDVWGVPATNSHGERYVQASDVLLDGTGSIGEMTLSGRALGGVDYLYNPVTHAGQMGVTGGIGLNNIGLLVSTSGVCSLNLANPNEGGDYYGAYYLFIDDGSQVVSRYRHRATGEWRQINGIKVEVNDSSIAAGSYVGARGISSIEQVNGEYQRRLQPRTGMGDVVKLRS